jgi:hypothetical protein
LPFWRFVVTPQGNRDNIDSMAGGSQKVLNQVLRLVDSYDLYGSVAYPKKHSQKDISDIYRLPFATRGVFTNVALQEPFGLTVIEVSGLARSRSVRMQKAEHDVFRIAAAHQTKGSLLF